MVNAPVAPKSPVRRPRFQFRLAGPLLLMTLLSVFLSVMRRGQ